MHNASDTMGSAFPEISGEVIATATMCRVKLGTTRLTRAELVLTEQALYIETRPLLRSSKHHKMRLLDIYDTGSGVHPTAGPFVVVKTADVNAVVILPSPPKDEFKPIAQEIYNVTLRLEADPTTRLGKAFQEKQRKKVNMAGLMLLGWELGWITEGDEIAERAVENAMFDALDDQGVMLGRIGDEFERLNNAGLDTMMRDVQTLALRSAGYLDARGLADAILIDFENPQ